MLNTYTLEVYKKDNKPCFVITIEHIMRAGVYFFNSLKDANNFINEEKKGLEVYAPLEYNENGVTDKNYMYVIKTVLNDENICIGENGRTIRQKTVYLLTLKIDY